MTIWVYYTGTTLWVLLSILLGYSVARRRVKKGISDANAPIGTGVAALLGLLAFILAFTFNLAMNRFETRKALLLDEVNALETVYLRTDFLPEPSRTKMRSDLRRYVDIRVELTVHPEQKDVLLREAAEIRHQLWEITRGVTQQPPSSAPYLTPFIFAVNDVFTLNNKRITAALINELPDAMWAVLYLLTAIAMMGFGFLFGMAGKLNWPVFITLALAHAAIICLIVDLDKFSSQGTGIIRFSYKPMIELQQRMHEQP